MSKLSAFAKRFIEELENQQGSDSNLKLARKLKLEENVFNETKEFLIKNGRIVSERSGHRLRLVNNDKDFSNELEQAPPSVENIEDIEAIFPLFKENSWQREAENVLRDKLTERELESCISDELKNYFATAKERKFNTRYLSKQNLVCILIRALDRDLLHSRELRDILCRKFNLPLIKNFVPNGSKIVELIRISKLPIQLRGHEKSDFRAPHLSIKPKRNLPKLEDFQNEIKLIITQKFITSKQSESCLISLPTGAGKTRTAVEIIYEFINSKVNENEIKNNNLVMWIADKEELCDQAIEHFEEIWEEYGTNVEVTIARLFGEFYKDYIEYYSELVKQKGEPVIFVATIQTLTSIFKSEDLFVLHQAIKENLNLLIIDEAHHTGAKTYIELIEKIKEHQQKNELSANMHLLGLTATPIRKTGQEYSISEIQKYFKQLVVPSRTFAKHNLNEETYQIKSILQDLNIIAKEVFSEIETGLIIDKKSIPKKMNLEDYTKIRVEEAKSKHSRREKICRRIREIMDKDPNAAIMYFGVSVNDAQMISFILQTHKIKSSFVDGNLNKESRHRIINEFKEGKLDVICSCQLLSTGFDAPRVTHIILGWQTTSPILFHQMIGRGLRGTKFGGTEECQIIQCVDDYRNLEPNEEFALEKYFKAWKKIGK